MNDRMYEHAATQANLATLRERGVRVLDPGDGRARLPAASTALGARPSPRELRPRRAAPLEVEALVGAPSGPWDGMRVLVSAGGTREPIDSVRFIGNRSSGRMGFALAEQRRDAGRR